MYLSIKPHDDKLDYWYPLYLELCGDLFFLQTIYVESPLWGQHWQDMTLPNHILCGSPHHSIRLWGPPLQNLQSYTMSALSVENYECNEIPLHMVYPFHRFGK
jgi:hypothetical protein